MQSFGYYQSMYVRRGESGRIRDSAACHMITKDALAAQREMARRLASAVPVENTEGEEKEQT